MDKIREEAEKLPLEHIWDPNKCANCGHQRRDHIPQQDAPDGERYPGECNICGKCSRFVTREEVRARVDESNLTYHDADRSKMIEFRVTFGWNQPHGPYPKTTAYPGDQWGHYSTVWAPDSHIAAKLIRARYGNKFAFLYYPEQWAKWGLEMGEIKELEQLQYWGLALIFPWPEENLTHRGAHLGTSI